MHILMFESFLKVISCGFIVRCQHGPLGKCLHCVPYEVCCKTLVQSCSNCSERLLIQVWYIQSLLRTHIFLTAYTAGWILTRATAFIFLTYFYYYYRMHEMQSILTDVRSVCQSVCLSRGSSRLHCAKTAEQINMLFGVNTSGGKWNIIC